MSATIERHNHDALFKGRSSLYSHCVRVTNATATLYLAGQLARDEHGRAALDGGSCGRRGRITRSAIPAASGLGPPSRFG